MARRKAKKPKKEKKKAKAEQPPAAATPEVPVVAIPDKKALAKAEKVAKRDADKQLKMAEADLARLKRKEATAKKREARRMRALDRDIERIERSMKRTARPIVALLAVLNGLAATLAIIHLWWPDYHIYDAVLYRPSEHWELVGFFFIGSSAGSVAFLTRSPTVDYQRRSRYALLLYLAVALVVTLLGILLAVGLEPLQSLEVDFLPAMKVLVVILAVVGIPIPILSLIARSGRVKIIFRIGYHRVMAVLTTVAVVTMVLLPILALAHYELFTEVGLTMTVSGGLGMLFPLPAILGTILAEFLLARRALMYAPG
jgi:hypothetical protein